MKELISISKLAAVLFLVVLAVPATSFCEMRNTHGKEHMSGQGHMMSAMGSMERMDAMMGTCFEHAEKIGLSADQLAKLKPIHHAMKIKQVRFKADQKIADIELMAIMEVKDFNLEKAIATVIKSDELQAAHHLDMLKAMKDMRTVLTDEQFNTMKKEMTMNHGDNKPARSMKKK